MAHPVTQQDTQPPAETLAEAMHCALKDAAAIATAEADRLAKEMPMGSRSEGTARAIAADITRLAVAALTRRAGGDAIPAGEVDWLKVARLAGEHGVRYRTNTALLKFLEAVAYTPKPPAGGDAGAVERATSFMRHDGLCAAVGAYGYCDCGMEAAKAAALALPAPVVEGAHLAAFHALHGPQADPFGNPEAFEFCGKIADAVLAALSGGNHDAD